MQHRTSIGRPRSLRRRRYSIENDWWFLSASETVSNTFFRSSGWTYAAHGSPYPSVESGPVNAIRRSFRYVILPCASHIQTRAGAVSAITRKRFSLSRRTASAFRFRARCINKASATISTTAARMYSRSRSQKLGCRYNTTEPGGSADSGMYHRRSCRQTTTTRATVPLTRGMLSGRSPESTRPTRSAANAICSLPSDSAPRFPRGSNTALGKCNRWAGAVRPVTGFHAAPIAGRTDCCGAS